jgi:FkbM family methyltransferase
MKPFTESDRYDYPELCRQSIVFDCGGYEGRFARSIFEKYGCAVHVFEPCPEFAVKCRANLKGLPDNVCLHAHGIGGVRRMVEMRVKGDMTGPWAEGAPFVAELRGIGEMLRFHGLEGGKIDLLKLNIEGGEFEVLEEMLFEYGQEHLGIDNIQVQFHTVVPDWQERYNTIRAKLLESHRLTYDAPWCWENYKLRRFHNQSQAGQDMFVLKVLGGLDGVTTKGFFVDVGSNHPKEISNTWAFEKLGWHGVMIDSDANCVNMTRDCRSNPVILGDATKHKWSLPPVVDYLSLDVDESSAAALANLPLDTTVFRVITMEHDCYRFGDGPKTVMRKMLRDRGYVLVCSDVRNGGCPYEDWWVEPTLEAAASPFKCDNTEWQSIITRA